MGTTSAQVWRPHGDLHRPSVFLDINRCWRAIVNPEKPCNDFANHPGVVFIEARKKAGPFSRNGCGKSVSLGCDLQGVL